MTTTHNFNSVLLHSETSDGTVVPIWEEVESDNVVVLKDVMASRQSTQGIQLVYDRIPITAERPPDFSDLSEMIDVVLRASRDTPIVVNCQLGRGRSTLASIILLLIRQWLDSRRTPQTPHFKLQRTMSMSTMSPIEPTSSSSSSSSSKQRQSYQVINSRSLSFHSDVNLNLFR